MFDNLLEVLYNKVFVNIVLKHSSTDVYIELCSKKSIKDHAKKSFHTRDLTQDILDFINFYVKESPYFYISFLDISVKQGAIPTCDKNRLEFYEDLSASKYKCYNQKWSYYTSKTELYALERNYERVGIDFIFSPYSLLQKFFQDKISTTMAMYVLIQDSFITLAIFDKSELLYAQHLDVETTSEEDDMLSSMDEDEDIDLEIEQSVDVDDVIEDLDDFGDIKDLDSIEEIDDFSYDKDLTEELTDVTEEIVKSDTTEISFNEDYQRFSLIQASLSHYYNDEKYESLFVETVYIADGVGVSSDLKNYLEEEMFLNVYLRKLDISMEVCMLAKEELFS